MPEPRMAFEELANSARLALARGDRDGARASLSAALQAAATDGGVSGESADGLIRLGAIYQDAGLTAEAERLFGDAVAVAEATLGPDDAGVVPALISLGTALVARGANAQAEPLLARALAIGAARLGPDHPDLNLVLNALSRVYLKQGDFRRAEPLLEQLLAMKRNKGEEHPEVATVLASLAAVRQGVGDHEGAEQLARRALHIREATLAPNHFAVASALELLADACAARGNLSEALLRYQRALAIREQTLGAGHVSLRVVRERIADLQLQSADAGLDDSIGDAPFMHLTAPTMPVVPARPMPAALVVHVEAPRPVVRAEPSEPSESRQQALVLPTVGGALSLEDEIRNIENELNDAANNDAARSPMRALFRSAQDLLSTRRAQVALLAVASLTLLIAAFIAQPATIDDAVAQPLSRRAALPTTGGDSISRAEAPAGDSAAAFVHTASGSLALRTPALPAATKAGSRDRQAEPQANNSSRDRDAVSPSLDLGRNVRLPAAAIPVPGADSIARAADPTAKLGEQPFTKQFWTSGIDKRASEAPSGPTSARLIGPMPEPTYPVFLRKNNVEGEVVVQFVVDETGKPDMSTLEVVQSPHEAMTASVRRVIEQLRFEPARTGGTTPKPRTEVVRSSFLFKSGGK